MNTRTYLSRALSLLLPLGVLALGDVPAAAVDFYLAARPFTATLPDGVTVPMWGFALCDATFTTCGPTTSPGPTLRVSDSEPTPVALDLHIRNELPVATSLVMPDQLAPLAPVKFTDPEGRARTRSFTAETPASGGEVVYHWSNLRPGTSLYQSGTQPQVQVQMGLFGVLIFDAGPGEAYAGVPYDTEALVIYSEIDPALHAAVDDHTYGTPAYPSTFDYKPTYFLVNGAPYFGGRAPLDGGVVGERLLLRLVNAGLTHRAPQLLGGTFALVAEEGHALPFANERYGTLVPAGGTKDAVFVPDAAGRYALYDRMLNLTTRDVTGGGGYAFLEVAPLVAAAGAPVPFAAWPTGAATDGTAPLAPTPTPDEPGLTATDGGGLACSGGPASDLSVLLILLAAVAVRSVRRGRQRS